MAVGKITDIEFRCFINLFIHPEQPQSNQEWEVLFMLSVLYWTRFDGEIKGLQSLRELNQYTIKHEESHIVVERFGSKLLGGLNRSPKEKEQKLKEQLKKSDRYIQKIMKQNRLLEMKKFDIGDTLHEKKLEITALKLSLK
jgi:hypothetical protein